MYQYPQIQRASVGQGLVSRALARNPNVMTRGAASTKLVLLACGKHIRNDLGY